MSWSERASNSFQDGAGGEDEFVERAQGMGELDLNRHGSSKGLKRLPFLWLAARGLKFRLI